MPTFATRAPFLSLLRPHHWIKNVLVFAGVFFAHRWHDGLLMTKAVLLFMAFCCTASAIYVINDYLDRHADRLHPKKRFRPLAQGLIDPRIAMLKAHLLLAIGWVLAWYSGSGLAFGMVVAYTLINVAYCYRLKHVPIVDVLLLAASYLVRIVAGTEGLNIPISSWLFLCGLSLAMLLGFGKRQAEKYTIERSQQRKSVQAYHDEFLRMALTLTAAIFLVFYGLYSLDAASTELHGRKLVLTYPWVIFAVFHYLHLLVQQNPLAEDPATLVWRDRTMAALVIGWLISFTVIIVIA